MLRVVLADDNHLVREGLAALLGEVPELHFVKLGLVEKGETNRPLGAVLSFLDACPAEHRSGPAHLPGQGIAEQSYPGCGALDRESAR